MDPDPLSEAVPGSTTMNYCKNRKIKVLWLTYLQGVDIPTMIILLVLLIKKFAKSWYLKRVINGFQSKGCSLGVDEDIF